MTVSIRRAKERFLLPLSLGIADGIVNALTLASASIVHGRGLSVALGLRVGAVALLSAVFTVFVAEYAQLRAELAKAEYELNLTGSGRIAASRLGRDVANEAAAACALAAVASFAGAFLPLLIGAVSGPYRWSALVASVAALGGLGLSLATTVGGRRLRWVSAMVVMGVLVALAGVWLDIA